MSKRYYYECALEAAYMAKNFGMKFQAEWGEDLIASDVNLVACFYVGDAEHYANHCLPHYINPNSLPLLEPHKGDVGRDSKGYFVNHHPWSDPGEWSLENALASEKGYEPELPVRIILRDGKHFFWPKVEE